MKINKYLIQEIVDIFEAWGYQGVKDYLEKMGFECAEDSKNEKKDYEQLVKDCINETVTSFFYYDRKNDSELNLDDMKYIIDNHILDCNDFLKLFEKEIREAFK